MLTSDYPFHLPRFIEASLPKKLRDLADDLEVVREIGVPTPAQLSDAPIISAWRPVITTIGLRMIGDVARHPRLGSTIAMTSQIWAADDRHRWLRSLGRFYRLGPPADASCSEFSGARRGA